MQTRETKITRFNKIQQEQTGTVYTGREEGGVIYTAAPHEVIQQAIVMGSELSVSIHSLPDWQSTFRLARKLKSVWQGEPEALEDAVKVFCEKANRPFEDFYITFLDVWDKVRFAEGEDVFEWAVGEAEREPLALNYCPTGNYRFVASLAWYLAQCTYPEPFWLPRERIAARLGTVPSTVTHIVNRLIKKDIIVCCNEEYSFRGKESKAKEYLFIAEPWASNLEARMRDEPRRDACDASSDPDEVGTAPDDTEGLEQFDNLLECIPEEDFVLDSDDEPFPWD
jgi:hypothetical protein